jgi:beta-barrel assembly-enhancing protease
MQKPVLSGSARLAARWTTPRLNAVVLAVALSVQPVVASHAQQRPEVAPEATSGAVASGALPGLGDGSDLTIADERRLGDSIARQIYRDPDYLDDPVIGDYLQSIWRPLLDSARARGNVPPELYDRFAWTLVIDRTKQVNAFALPGGYMGVNLGLLAVTESPQELASVLAHELSHVSQRHIARLIARQGRDMPLVMGALILGALAARNNADVANAAIVGSQALAMQNQLNFSRDMEREADRVGFGVMTEAGFPGQGFVSMFDKLQQASRLNDDGSFPYLRSHPLTTERIADMRLRLAAEPGAKALPHGPRVENAARAAQLPLPSTQLHALMAARSRVLAESVPDRWRAWFRAGSDSKAGLGDRYAAALSAHRLGLHAEALALARSLRDQGPSDTVPTLDALELELLLAAPGGTGDARFAALRDAALASESRAGVMQGALAALASGQAAPVAARLQRWVVSHPRDALAWQTLARAQGALGFRVRALRSEAEAYASMLDNEGALERLKAAQALPAEVRRSDAIEVAIVDARRREIEQQLRDSARDK